MSDVSHGLTIMTYELEPQMKGRCYYVYRNVLLTLYITTCKYIKLRSHLPMRMFGYDIISIFYLFCINKA